MILSTTSTLDNLTVQNYLGLVSGEAVIRLNFLKDFFKTQKDQQAELLKEATEIATTAMQKQAEKLNANAIIGISIDYEAAAANGSILIVVATGTAVYVS